MPVFDETLTPTEQEVDAVLAALVDSERVAGRDSGYQPFAVLLRDDPAGPVTGGIYGYQLYDWLFVQYLAVPAHQRGTGVGSELMQRAEAWARERGLAGIWLDTFAFQARAFYEKLGYSVFGAIEDHPRGSRRFFLLKRL